MKVTVAYQRQLWRRGMTAWWRSVVPTAPFIQRAIFWAVVWLAIGALAGGITVFGLSPTHVLAGLIGAGLLIGVFSYLQRTRMSRFWDVIGTHWDKAGETTIIFGPEGLRMSNDVATTELSWRAVDAIAAAKGGTVIRSGISMTVIPDTALPDGMTPRAFRAELGRWRSA